VLDCCSDKAFGIFTAVLRPRLHQSQGEMKGALFPPNCSPSQLLTCKCVSENATPTDSRESWPGLSEGGAFEVSY